MSTLTLQYQYPEEAQRLRRAQPRAYKRQVSDIFDATEPAERWYETSRVLGQVMFDTSAVNAVLGEFTTQPEYSADALLNAWGTLLAQAEGGGTGLVLRAPVRSGQMWGSNCHYIPSSLVSEAEECTKILVDAFWTSQLQDKIPRNHHYEELLQVMRNALRGGKAPVREDAIGAIAKRVAELRSSAAEEEIQINDSSLQDLEEFVQHLPFTVPPFVFLLDEGTFRLVWRGDREQVALEFLGEKAIRYIFFAARPEPVSEAKSAGIDDTLHIVDQIKALGLAHLIGHVG